MENYFNDVVTLYSTYSTLRDELTSIQHQAEHLADRQIKISKELEDTRMAEKTLINKLEELLNRKITQEDLLQIINTYEK